MRRRMKLLLVSLIVFVVFASASVALAAAGALDTSFGGDGKVITDFGGTAAGVAIQSDGKIVAAGTSTGEAATTDFALARYNPNGSLDTSFDDDGKVTTDIVRCDVAWAVAIQPDGKIVAAGNASLCPTGPIDFALARYNPNGSLDKSFSGDGKVTTDFGRETDSAFAVAIQPDGKIVAAGLTSTGLDFALVRYNPNGSLDKSFGGDGKVTTDFGGSDFAFGVAIQPNNRIVAAGYTSTDFGSDFALARYFPSGRLDNYFDSDGKVTTDFGADERANGVVIQRDGSFNGRIVAAGQQSFDPEVGGGNFALARYNPNGSLDKRFGGDGKVTTDIGLDGVATGVAIQVDLKVVAAGTSTEADFALARYNTDGSLDKSFSGDGKVTTDFGAHDTAQAVAIQPDGKIVAAGYIFRPDRTVDFALARYLGR